MGKQPITTTFQALELSKTFYFFRNLSVKLDEIKAYGENEARNMYKIKLFIDSAVVTNFHIDSYGITIE